MKRKIFSFLNKIQGSAVTGSIFLLLLLSIVATAQFASHNTESNGNSFLSINAANAQLVTRNATNTPQNASSFELRGLVGSTIAGEVNDQVQQSQVGDLYTVTGRWRIVVNQSSLDRFFANLTVALTDGSESRNIIVEDKGPYSALVASNNSNTIKSNINATIYPNDFKLTNITTPVQLEITGNKVLRMVIDLDGNQQPLQLQILRILNGKPIYGTIYTIESR